MTGAAIRICLDSRQFAMLADGAIRLSILVRRFTMGNLESTLRGSPRLGGISSRLVYKLNGLVNASVEVIPDRLSLNSSDSDGFLVSGCNIHIFM